MVDKSMYPDTTNAEKKGKMINSEFLNGMEVSDAIEKAIEALEDKKQKLLQFKQRLAQVIQHKLMLSVQKLDTQRLTLRQLNPSAKIERYQQTIQIHEDKLQSLQAKQLKQLEHQLGLLAQTLHTASPLATLGRGYAIIKKGSEI